MDATREEKLLSLNERREIVWGFITGERGYIAPDIQQMYEVEYDEIIEAIKKEENILALTFSRLKIGRF